MSTSTKQAAKRWKGHRAVTSLEIADTLDVAGAVAVVDIAVGGSATIAETLAVTGNTALLAGLRTGRASVTTATANIDGTSYIIGVNRAGAVTLTVLSVVIALEGFIFMVNDEGGNTGTAGQEITIVGESGETLDGQSSLVLNSNYNSVILYAAGSNLYTGN